MLADLTMGDILARKAGGGHRPKTIREIPAQKEGSAMRNTVQRNSAGVCGRYGAVMETLEPRLLRSGGGLPPDFSVAAVSSTALYLTDGDELSPVPPSEGTDLHRDISSGETVQWQLVLDGDLSATSCVSNISLHNHYDASDASPIALVFTQSLSVEHADGSRTLLDSAQVLVDDDAELVQGVGFEWDDVETAAGDKLGFEVTAPDRSDTGGVILA